MRRRRGPDPVRRLLLTVAAMRVFVPGAHAVKSTPAVVSGAVQDGSRCLNDCNANSEGSSHGFCTGGQAPLCECLEQWSNDAWDCSERVCPSGTSWFDMPVSAATAHTTETACSSRGQCGYSNGLCACAFDYEGHACQRLKCPGYSSKGPCSGHGQCQTMKEVSASGTRPDGLPATSYSGWEGDMIQGCVCDAGWSGFDCSEQQCPMGSDPLFRGNIEIQSITTTTPHVAEVQAIIFTAIDDTSTLVADIDEVQSLVIVGSGTLAGTNITVTFDSTGSGSDCALCIVRSISTATVTLSGVAATDAQALSSGLQNNSNIGAGGVSVAAVVSATEVTFTVTFIGANVGGDVSLLQLSVDSVAAGGVWAPAATPVTTVTVGSELAGTITLTYNDTTSYPRQVDLAAGGDYGDSAAMAAVGARTAAGLSVASTESALSTALSALVQGGVEPAANSVAVTRVGTGGPGLKWLLTFSGSLRTRGNLAQVGADVTSLSMAAHAAFTTTTTAVNATTVVDGSFMSGTLSVQMPYLTPDYTFDATPSTPAATWNVAPAALAAAINALDTGYGFGTVVVSRTRYYGTSTATYWTGGYTWSVSFLSESIDLPALTAIPALLPSAATLTVATIQHASPATAEVDAVQLIDCICAACSDRTLQTFRLRFGDEVSAAIPYDATAAELRAALAAMRAIPDVTVALYDQSSGSQSVLCDADGGTAAVTFTHNPGVVPPLRVAMDVVDGYLLPATSRLGMVTSGFGAWGGRAKAGTRRLLACSGRGVCHAATGVCTCFSIANASQYGASNDGGGAAAPGPATADFGKDNCGYPLATITACPVSANGLVCAGSGNCSGSPSFRCFCSAGRTGADCSQYTCPTGKPWFDTPLSETSAHLALMECSARGSCNRATGDCTCHGLFRGSNCGFSACPSNALTRVTADWTKDTCANGQPCVSLSELSLNHRYSTDDVNVWNVTTAPTMYAAPWDASMIRGCACSHTREYIGPNAWSQGHATSWDCQESSCPYGRDPRDEETAGAALAEVQTLTCNATSGMFALRFRGHTTQHFPYNAFVLEGQASYTYLSASYNTLERALMELQIVGRLAITTSQPFSRFCNALGVSTAITFQSLEGDLPLLEILLVNASSTTYIHPTSSTTVTETVPGSDKNYVCSRRGVCSRTTGVCHCSKQYGSSDGALGLGQLGDCGNKDVLHRYAGHATATTKSAASAAA